MQCQIPKCRRKVPAHRQTLKGELKTCGHEECRQAQRRMTVKKLTREWRERGTTTTRSV